MVKFSWKGNKLKKLTTLKCIKLHKGSAGNRGNFEDNLKHVLSVTFFGISPHPYIFFNKDSMSMTFVGFNVDSNGRLIDPTTKHVIEDSIISPKLLEELLVNKVNFRDDFNKWNKQDMINKICTVIGVDNPHDPDESYVLTVDNVTKVLAILMRFRYVFTGVGAYSMYNSSL